jgi:hypothetical protein
MIQIMTFLTAALAAFSLFSFLGDCIDLRRQNQNFQRAFTRLLNASR